MKKSRVHETRLSDSLFVGFGIVRVIDTILCIP